MTQEEFFRQTQTDNLLRMRYKRSCNYPVHEGDKPDWEESPYYDIDKKLLYTELALRPHRIRARDRRKVRLNN